MRGRDPAWAETSQFNKFDDLFKIQNKSKQSWTAGHHGGFMNVRGGNTGGDGKREEDRKLFESREREFVSRGRNRHPGRRHGPPAGAPGPGQAQHRGGESQSVPVCPN